MHVPSRRDTYIIFDIDSGVLVIILNVYTALWSAQTSLSAVVYNFVKTRRGFWNMVQVVCSIMVIFQKIQQF